MTIVQTGQLNLENGSVDMWQPRSGGEVSFRIVSDGYRATNRGDDWPHYQYTATFRRGKRTLTTQYRMGIGRTDLPDPRDVLSSMFEDAEGVKWEEFGGWAMEYGYELDDKNAQRMYKACEDLGTKLEAFFGSSHEDWQDTLMGWNR